MKIVNFVSGLFVHLLALSSLSCQSAGSAQLKGSFTESSASQNSPSQKSESWFIQLQNCDKVQYDERFQVFVVDLFDTPDAFIQQVHSNKGKVIAYLSGGSWEDWRPDAQEVDKAAIGAGYDGYPNERWLDIRHESVKSLLKKRFDLAKERGFDGVDIDNVDGYTHKTGFNLSATDQLTFNRFLAQEAHSRSLLVGLKNDLAQVVDLVESFDFAINEQCFMFNECGRYQPFIAAKKPVINIEYVEQAEQAVQKCQDLLPNAQKFGLLSVVATRKLDGFMLNCAAE